MSDLKYSFLQKRLKLTPVRLIVISYLLATFVAMILLSLPVSLKEGVKLSFVDTMFTSVSAISVTGLTVVSTIDTFSVFGVFMLMIVMQFGAIGLMTIGTFIYVMLGRNVGLTHRRLIMIDQNRGNISGMVHEKVFHSLFYSVTPRNGGLATLDVNLFSTPTLFITSILMFVGASPSSVGGGIRTTTLAVMLLTIFTFAKGKSEVRVFKKRLATEDIMKSFVVFTTSIMLVITAIILLDRIEHYPFISIIFEVCSAFGTTGLSMGLTTELSTPGKYVIIALMFIGRIGILSALLFISSKNEKESYYFPEEKVLIG